MSLVAAHAAARSADLVAAPDMPEGYSVRARLRGRQIKGACPA